MFADKPDNYPVTLLLMLLFLPTIISILAAAIVYVSAFVQILFGGLLPSPSITITSATCLYPACTWAVQHLMEHHVTEALIHRAEKSIIKEAEE